MSDRLLERVVLLVIAGQTISSACMDELRRRRRRYISELDCSVSQASNA
jgi:hypothetical protein